ncbi:ankyrin repeat domain-containing protein [Rickettsiella endosymbiont of Miltochrista miniata]|uniref:ankyrin repeat domain-containing protein n=1 Tax=Rickettsiella endosymbiont of Miltochrista miniata TaxID=3066239 RepID=UPI00313BECCE
MPYIEKPVAINNEMLSRVRRYDPKDTNIAKLFTAIREHKTGNPPKDKINKIQNLLSQPIQNINSMDANDHDNTLLHVAASKAHEDIIMLLINQAGIDKSIKNRQDKTAFDLASDLDVSTYSNKQSIMAKLNPGPLVHAGPSGVSANLTPQLGDEVNYPSSGLKNSLHGNIYQLKLLMLFLKRGLSENYDFRLSTEWDAAEKFDDLVFKYNDQNQVKYRFLQAKHKQDQSKKIKIGDLLTADKNGEFNLEKYFISYLKIKNNPDFNGNLEDFTICTNINFDLSNTIVGQPIQLNEVSAGKNKGKKISVEAMTGNDVFFKDGGTRYKLLANNDLIAHLKQGSEVQKEVQELNKNKNKINVNTDIDTEINQFLEKLIFAVDQPNEVELGKIISQEMGEEFNLIDANLVTDKFLRDMLDWFKEKEGKFLSPADGEEFFADTKGKVTKLVMLGPTSAYSKKLTELGVSFNDDQLTEVKNFLNPGSSINSKQILNLEAPKNTRLSAIKVNQILLGSSVYKEKRDSYIFVPLSKLLRLRDEVLDAFRAQGTGDLLVIECKNGPGSNIHALYSELKTIVNNNPKKKIILITKNGDGGLASSFKNDAQLRTKYQENRDNIGGLSDLTPTAQAIILGKTVSFQGKETPLGYLISDPQKNLINEEVLSKLVNGDEVSIGKEVPKLTDIDKVCYVGRTFDHELKKIDPKSSNQVTRDKKTLTRIEDRIAIIAAKPGMGKSVVLTRLAEQEKQESPFSWVIKINLIEHVQAFSEENFDNLNRVKAIDFLSKLMSLKNTLEKELFKNNLSRPDKVALFFDGFDEMSPTCKKHVITLLTVLKETQAKKLWVTTRTHARTTLEEALKGASYTLNPLSEAGQKEFLKKFFSTHLVEEINEERLTFCTEKFLDFFTSKISSDKKFTAIPLQLKMAAEHFQNKFNTFYNNPNANEFSLGTDFNLVDFYKEFIRDKFNKFSAKQTHMDASDKLTYDEFLEQRQLLALYVVFEVVSKQSIDAEWEINQLLPGKMEKIEILISEMKEGKGYAGVVDRIVDGKPNFVHLTFAEYLAAQKLVDIFKEQQQQIEQERIAIAHSENLLEDTLVEGLEVRLATTIRSAFDIFYEERAGEGVQRFIDGIVTKDLRLHTAILNRNYERIETLSKIIGDRNSPDLFGRKPIHLAAMKGDYAACDKLLQFTDVASHINTEDTLFKWTPIRYIDGHKSTPAKFKLVNLFLSRGANLDDMVHLNWIMEQPLINIELESSVESNVELEDSVERKSSEVFSETLGQRYIKHIMEGGNLYLLKALLKKHPHLKQFTTVERETLLHLATSARDSSLEIVKYLIDEQKLKVNVAASDGATPLHNAVEEGHLDIVKYLLDKGADVNAREGADHWTALHLAVKGGHIEVVNILLECKDIDLNLKDKDGKTALDLAVGDEAIEKLLNERKQNNLKRPSSALDDESTANKKNCLSSRRKREAEACLFSWDDIDKINLEKEKPRDINKIDLDSAGFLELLKDSGAAKRTQLLQLAGSSKVSGDSEPAVQRLGHHINRIRPHVDLAARIVSIPMRAQMATDTLKALIKDDGKTIAINLGWFMGGGHAFGKLSASLASKGESLAAAGNKLLGKSLQIGTPFLRRGTSILIAIDFANQVKALQQGDEEALGGVISNGVNLGIDLLEAGIEVGEIAGMFSGISAITGPAGEVVGALVMLGVQIYDAVRSVARLDHLIHLSGWEKFKEGWRAFLGIAPEAYIKKMADLIEHYKQFLVEKLEFLKSHPAIKYYIFSALEEIAEKCRVVIGERRCPSDGGGLVFAGKCSNEKTVCEPVFSEVNNSFVSLREKQHGFKLSRVKPASPAGSTFICLPTGDSEAIPVEGAYKCNAAIGIMNNGATGDAALIDLGQHHDYAAGFLNKTNYFLVSDGYKNLKGGNQDDIFIVQAQEISGDLHANGGIDTLILSGFQPAQDQIEVNLPMGYLRYNGNKKFSFTGIERVFGSSEKAYSVTAGCRTQVLDTQGGPTVENPDKILIPDDHCHHEMKVLLTGNLVLTNEASTGNFNYDIESGVGEISVALPVLAGSSTHKFTFNATVADVSAILTQRSIDDPLRQNIEFQLDNFKLKVSVISSNNTLFYFKDGVELKLGDKNLYLFLNTDQSLSTIIDHYAVIAGRLDMTCIIQGPRNEVAVIGHSKHEVMHNDPRSHKTHLHGNGGESLFVIDSGLPQLPITPLGEVVLYHHQGDSHVDSLDLRALTAQIRTEFNATAEILFVPPNASNRLGNDILLLLTVKSRRAKAVHEIMTVRVKDALIDEWYRDLHVILNVAPLKVFGPLSNLRLVPVPLEFKESHEIINVGIRDVEENTVIIIPRNYESYELFRDGNNLRLTNTLSNYSTIVEPLTILLENFYNEPKLETLSIEFLNKRIVIKEELAKINVATWDEAQIAHEEELYAMAFQSLSNHTDFDRHPRNHPTDFLTRARRSIQLSELAVTPIVSSAVRSSGILQALIGHMTHFFADKKQKALLSSGSSARVLHRTKNTCDKDKGLKSKQCFKTTALSTKRIIPPSKWRQPLMELGTGAIAGSVGEIFDKLVESYPNRLISFTVLRTFLDAMIMSSRYFLSSSVNELELEDTLSPFLVVFLSNLFITASLQSLLIGLEASGRPLCKQVKRGIQTLYNFFFLQAMFNFFTGDENGENKLTMLLNWTCYAGANIGARKATRMIMNTHFFNGSAKKEEGDSIPIMGYSSSK